MLLGAFTSWEPKRKGARAPRPDEQPIAGVDYAEQGKGFDLLPANVQQFLVDAKKQQANAA